MQLGCDKSLQVNSIWLPPVSQERLKNWARLRGLQVRLLETWKVLEAGKSLSVAPKETETLWVGQFTAHTQPDLHSEDTWLLCIFPGHLFIQLANTTGSQGPGKPSLQGQQSCHPQLPTKSLKDWAGQGDVHSMTVPCSDALFSIEKGFNLQGEVTMFLVGSTCPQGRKASPQL